MCVNFLKLILQSKPSSHATAHANAHVATHRDIACWHGMENWLVHLFGFLFFGSKIKSPASFEEKPGFSFAKKYFGLNPETSLFASAHTHRHTTRGNRNGTLGNVKSLDHDCGISRPHGPVKILRIHPAMALYLPK